nr:hypothetical protein [Allomuricauda sp.]
MDENEKIIEEQKLNFEQLKFEKESSFREREIRLKENENKKVKWNDPLYIAVLVAVIGLLSNAGVAYINNEATLGIEEQKNEATLELEKQKAEAARILEVVKTGNPDIAAENLKFLLETGLITKDSARISAYIDSLKPGEGVQLAVSGFFDRTKISEKIFSLNNGNLDKEWDLTNYPVDIYIRLIDADREVLIFNLDFKTAENVSNYRVNTFGLTQKRFSKNGLLYELVFSDYVDSSKSIKATLFLIKT